MQLRPSLIIAILLFVIAAGFYGYRHGILHPTENPTKVPSCNAQQVTVMKQNRDGASCSIDLDNGTTQALSCDQLPNYPVGSKISVCYYK